jgi:hypothetical protein
VRIPLRVLAAGTALGSIAVFWEGNVGLGLTVVAAAALLAVFTFADRLPLLQRLPVIGATPWPSVAFLFEPTKTKTALFDPVESGQTRDLIVCMQVLNSRRKEIERARINVWVTGAADIERCEQDGSPGSFAGSKRRNDGPYWTESGITLGPAATELFFRVTLPGPDEYEAVLRLWAPEFHRDGKDFRRPLRVDPA